MQLPQNERIPAEFYWFVSASYGNLLYPEGHNYVIPLSTPQISNSSQSTTSSHGYGYHSQHNQRPITHKMVTDVYGFKNNGFLKNIFKTGTCYSRSLIRSVILKNKDEYIDSSIKLPQMKEFHVMSKTERVLNIIGNHITRTMMTALNAGDIDSAVKMLNNENIQTGNQIVQLFTNNIRDNLNNKKIELNSILEMALNEEDRKQRVESLQKAIEELQLKIDDIEKRIIETNTCSICMDDMEMKTITSCGHAYCFKCILEWMNQGYSVIKCPMCRTVINQSDLNVVDDENKLKTSNSNEASSSSSSQENKDKLPVIDKELPSEINNDILEEYFNKKVNTEDNTKLENFNNIFTILKQLKNTKTLVFSEYPKIFEEAQISLQSQNVSYSFIRGNSNTINKRLDRFKSGEISTLFADPKYYGSGLNLEMTTDIIICHKFDSDIEKQVIGRAQRVGRKEPLRVWYIVNDKEVVN